MYSEANKIKYAMEPNKLRILFKQLRHDLVYFTWIYTTCKICLRSYSVLKGIGKQMNTFWQDSRQVILP